MSPASIDPIACQLATLMELEKNRTEPSPNTALTPPVCRLRAVLTRVSVSPGVLQGISGSSFGTMPHRPLSGTELFGGLIDMKMFGQWLGLEEVASCQMCPRKSPSGQFPAPFWLLSDLATMTSDMSSVFDVPSVICTICV